MGGIEGAPEREWRLPEVGLSVLSTKASWREPSNGTEGGAKSNSIICLLIIKYVHDVMLKYCSLGRQSNHLLIRVPN